MEGLEPGANQPYAPADAASIGALFGVDAATVESWVATGLPQSGGLIDPLTCCNWLSWGRLDLCPVLARRWRRYLACFEPHQQGASERLAVTWHRSHRLYLPTAVEDLHWWLPDPVVTPQQRPRAEGGQALHATGVEQRPEACGQMLCAASAEDVLEVVGRNRVVTNSWRVELPAGEREDLLALTTEVVADFRYEYRRHPHAQRPQGRRGSGTCLDCVLDLGAALGAAGREWRLQAGVVARSDIANAHYWLTVAVVGGGWCPIDPSIPAIARMLGVDWTRWVAAYVGAIDARRITLSDGVGSWPGGGQRFLSPVPGEAWCAQGGLWPCIDWVCGETVADFEVETGAL